MKNFDGSTQFRYVTNTSSSKPTKRTIEDVNVWEHTGPGNRVSDMSPVEMFVKEKEGDRTIGSPKKRVKVIIPRTNFGV